jgi:Putative beta-barrel porin-2, OmpL-like. bbp2
MASVGGLKSAIGDRVNCEVHRRRRPNEHLPRAAFAAALLFCGSHVRAQDADWAPAPPSQAARQSDAEIVRRIAAIEAELAELKALMAEKSLASALQDTTEKDLGSAPRAAAPDESVQVDDLRDLKFGAALDTYYAFNFNRPIGRVNLLRAYDVTSNNFSLNQANVIVESAPDPDAGRRFGGRLDFQFGQATETLQGSLANEPRPWVYRNIFQAYGTYVLPVGNGLTVDFGKWASSLSVESNYTKDQNNYSRSFYFNFLPFYHSGARVNYKPRDSVALNYWITNGAQQTEEFNNFKDQLFGVTLQPYKGVSWSVQYYLGQEHPDVEPIETPGRPTLPTQPGLSVTPVVPYFRGKLNVFDTYATWQASPRTTFSLEGDYVLNRSLPPAPDTHVYGGAVYARQQLTNRTALAGRAEYLRDHGGLFTGISQSLKETTITYDYRPTTDGFLIRAEWRRDFSDTPFFLTDTPGKLELDQHTATLGVVWWWGNKRQAW